MKLPIGPLLWGFVIGLVILNVVERVKQDQREREWLRSKDSLTAETALGDRALVQWKRRADLAEHQRQAQAESTAVLEAAYAALKARRPKVDTLALPDTGAVPVAIVRQERESWIGVVAHLDATVKAADRVIASQKQELAAAQDRITADSASLAIEHDLRMHWQALAQQAPVGKRSKLFGLIPLPDIQGGCGAGVQFSGDGYAGCGAQLGYTIHL